jgi:hypothetical protein
MIYSNRPVSGFAVVLLSLTAAGCGGGGSDQSTSAPAPAPVSPAMTQSFNDIAQYCGVSTRLPSSDTSTTVSVGSFSAQRDPDPRLSTYAALSAIGNVADPKSPLYAANLRLDTQDYRQSTLPPGFVRVSVGTADGSTGKGVVVVLDLPAGGIVCAAPAAWYKSNPPAIDPGTGRISTDTGATLHWESRDGAPLPVASLPGYAVDGFELVTNFAVKGSPVFFVERKRDMADPVNAQICRLSSPTKAWDCKKPTVADLGANWSFTLQGATAGTYVLTSVHPQAGQ